MQQPPSQSLQTHMRAKQALAAERHALLQQQATVLQEHVRAGLPLPGMRQEAVAAAAGQQQRQQLITQLVQEEAAAAAALEALKQGSSLAKAREVGERVLRQAQDLQQHNNNSSGSPSAGSLGRQRLQSVLLGPQANSTPAGDSSTSKQLPPRGGSRGAPQRQQQQQLDEPADALSSPPSLEDELLGSAQNQHQQHHPSSRQQQQLTAGQLVGSNQQQAPTADFVALQQQMAQLQHTLASQQQQQLMQPPQHAGITLPFNGTLPQLIAAGCCYQGPPSPSPWPQGPAGSPYVHPLGYSSYSPPPMMHPLAASITWGHMSRSPVASLPPPHMAYPQAASPAAGATSSAAAAAAGVSADAALASAVAAHVRDMTLLRMDVERTRGNAELAALQQQQHHQQQQQQQGQGPGLGLQDARLYPNSIQAAAAAGDGTGGAPLQQSTSGRQQPDQDSYKAGAAAAADPQHGDWLAAAAADDREDISQADPDEAAAGPRGSSQPSAAAAAGGGGSTDDEVLSLRADGVLAAGRGSGGEPDVLQVHVTAAGPFSKRGTYRVAVVLYDGFQPLSAGPGAQVTASTGRRAVVTQAPTTAGDIVSAAGPASSSNSSSSSSPAAAAGTAPPPLGIAWFQESLSIKGVRLNATTQLVFELYCAKPSVAGLPTKELLVAWAATPLLQGGQVRTLPCNCNRAAFHRGAAGAAEPAADAVAADADPRPRAPLELRGGADRLSAGHAGAPGDLEGGTPHPGASSSHCSSSRRRTSSLQVSGGVGASGSSSGHEDLPGVPAEAWVRVSRGLTPSEPYTQGDGMVVVVDGARFLPACTTVSRVVGSVWSSSNLLLAGPFEGVSQPSSEARCPAFMAKALLDAAQAGSSFDDPTATLLLQVHTIERSSRTLRVVGFGLLALFLDPRDGGQPLSRSISDYVLNSGAFQVPLHAGAPPADAPLRMTSLDDTPRVPCASLLVRLMSPEAAKAQRRKPPPVYGDRVYDSVTHAMPTALERKLYGRLLACSQARPPWSVREAARLVAWFRQQPGGLSGRRVSSSSSSSSTSAGSSRRTTGDTVAATKAYSTATSSSKQQQQQKQQAAAGGAQATDSGASSGGLFSRLFGGLTGAGSSAGSDSRGAVWLNTGDPAAAVAERPEDLEAAKAEPLPPYDGDIVDWMADALSDAESAAAAAAAAGGGGGPGLSLINFNLATEYQPDLGFCVAVDAAMRLSRPLPAACIISTSPPGSMYQDHPLVDDVRLTLDYDLNAPLASPRWLDGAQAFTGLPYTRGLVLLLDVRSLVPGSSSAAPAGWACLPVFEAAGPFVASGVYHLPLFQGIPSHHLLAELTEGGDPDAVLAAAIAAGRVRPTLDFASVCVRLVCGSRQGQLEAPAWNMPLAEQRLTRHTVSQLGAGFVSEMRKPMRSRTYAQAKPKALTDEQWVDQINDTLLKISGLDDQMNPDGTGRED